MKKNIFTLILLFTTLFANAQASADQIMNNVIDSYKKSKSISADIIVNNSKGNIIMQNNKFRLYLPEIKCWYNGNIQYTYSSETNEVNITKPTSEELQMTSPYSAISTFKANYKCSLLKSTKASEYSIKLQPKAIGNDIKEVHLIVSKSNMLISKIVLITINGEVITTMIKNISVGKTISDSAFVFNKNEVPKGTQIIDLR